MYTPSLVQRPDLAFAKPKISKADFTELVKSERAPEQKWSGKTLTVTIVAYNERESLLELVAKLEGAADPRVGVLVVDNGLDQDIKQALLATSVHYLEATRNLGCTGGRNLAAAFVQSDLISFLDADAAIDDTYIQACFDSMADPKSLCARGKVIPLTAGSRVPPSYDLGDESFPWYPSAEGISVWRTEPFKTAGGFEADLYGGEGMVLCYRMRHLHGHSEDQFIYYPGLVLRHDYNNDIKHLKAKELRNFTNRWSIDRRYPLLTDMIHKYRHLNQGKVVMGGEQSSKDMQRLMKVARADFAEKLEAVYKANYVRRWNAADTVAAGEQFKFAVVVPCYKLGGLIEETVRSIMRQTLDSLQIIVVDDVSNDTVTTRALNKLSEKVQVIYRSENGGASATRNTGIEAANAKYILCLDGDDLIEPTYLEEAYNLFELEPSISVVAPHVRMFGEKSSTWRVPDNVGFPQALLSAPIANASCYRKSVWQAVGGYDETMRGYEDWEFWIRVIKLGATIRNLPRFHYRYRIRPDSKVKTSNSNAVDIVSYIVEKHRELYEGNMTFVVANIYSRYAASRNHAGKEGKAPKKSTPTRVRIKRVRRKLMNFYHIAVVERDYKLFTGKIFGNIKTLGLTIIGKSPKKTREG